MSGDSVPADTLELIYDAALEPSLWQNVLQDLADKTGGDQAALILQDQTTGRGDALIANIDPTAIEEFFGYFATRNPMQQHNLKFLQSDAPPTLSVMTDRDVLPRDDLKRTEDFITAEKIKQKYTGEGTIHRMLLEVFDEHNNKLEKLLDKDFVRATLTKYKTVRKKTAEYIQFRYKKPDLYLEAIDYSFVTGLEMYLKTEDKIEHNTAMRYIKNLKKIINLAVNNQWMSHNPFNLFKCTYNKVNRVELEWEEINQLAAYHFKVKRLAEVRDTFLFCCYTGYAFVDVDKLTPQHVVTGADGVTWIKTTRTKTAIEANVPLIPQAIEIIERYKDHDARIVENRLLPVKSNQKMNAYLKEIGDLAGIEKVLTTHIARHTFATTVTLENDVPLETVSKMLGHTKLTTTQIYAKMKDKKVNRDMHGDSVELDHYVPGQTDHLFRAKLTT